MVIDPKTGKKLITPKEACRIYQCGMSNLRMLALSGELKRVVETDRRIYYFLDEVQRVAKEKAASAKKRGGRPRKGPSAA